jgi:ABC-type transport system involved in multi-copper enzyme maturation permease subunit
MSALLKAELLKLRTTRTFAALIGSALALSLALLVLSGLLTDYNVAEDVRLLFAGDFTGIFILLLGAMGMSGEWRHRTITSAVLAAPDRLRLLAAKTLSYAVAGVVVSFLITGMLMLIGTIILSSRDQLTLGSTDLIDVMWRNLVVAAYLGAVGVLVGTIVRSQVGAIIGLIVWFLIVESALFGLAPDVAKFAPLNGAPGGIIDVSFDDGDTTLLAPGIAALVMLGWVTAMFAAGAALIRGRDLT